MHAGGGYKGYDHQNCIECLKQTVKDKRDVVELDFMFTTDGILVCNHGWSDRSRVASSYDEFRNWQLESGGTPMSAADAIDILKKKKIRLIVDTQEKDVARVYRELLNICRSKNAMGCFRRIIPQIFCESK